MSDDKVIGIARLIMELSVDELLRLREVLAAEGGGDPTGVGAVIPPNLPLKESGIANPLPEDYWETAE